MRMIDGAHGEGGGQILRSALALSVVTGIPFCIDQIRANRPRGGLARQHLTAVEAAAAVSGAEVRGAAIGSRSLTFVPRQVVTGRHHFSVGTAGSSMLVLQTVLPPLLLANQASQLVLEGGTHNPNAPPFDFLQKAFLPLLREMGAAIDIQLERPGFYPAGGGQVTVTIEPGGALKGISIDQPLPVLSQRAIARVARLPVTIAHRELAVIRDRLGWSELLAEEIFNSAGPGNIILLEIGNERFVEVIVGFGEKKVRAETVAANAVAEAQQYLAIGAPVGPHLADQLLLPMAIAGQGCFLTMPLTEHSRTNIAVIQQFLEIEVDVKPVGVMALVRVNAPAADKIRTKGMMDSV